MKHYCLSCGTELKEEQLLCPKCGHCSLLDSCGTELKEEQLLCPKCGHCSLLDTLKVRYLDGEDKVIIGVLNT